MDNHTIITLYTLGWYLIGMTVVDTGAFIDKETKQTTPEAMIGYAFCILLWPLWLFVKIVNKFYNHGK